VKSKSQSLSDESWFRRSSWVAAVKRDASRDGLPVISVARTELMVGRTRRSLMKMVIILSE
jgi:hypothetical protein